MFNSKTTAEQVVKGLQLKNKVFLVTGVNSGLGKETLKVLANQNAKVIGTARTLDQAREACDRFGEHAIPLECELTNPKSIRSCIDNIIKLGVNLDGICANAGVLGIQKLELVEGVEKQFFVNHVGHFMLISKLLPILTDHGRVVLVSSDLHKRAPKGGIDFDNLDGSKHYNPLESYAISKFANVAYAKALQRREFANTPNKKSFAVHSGVTRTNVLRHQNALIRTIFSIVGPLIFKTVPQGAATQCFALCHPHAPIAAGQTNYLDDCKEAIPHPDTSNIEIQDRLWDETEKIIKRLG